MELPLESAPSRDDLSIGLWAEGLDGMKLDAQIPPVSSLIPRIESICPDGGMRITPAAEGSAPPSCGRMIRG